MKKFFICLCLLVLVLPMCAFAAKSPTTTNKIYSIPAIKYEVVDDVLIIHNIEKQFPKEELKDYLWYELLYIELDKEYDIVRWYFPADMSHLEKAKVVTIGTTVELQDAVIEDGAIFVDFTDYVPGNYYIAFFLEELV